MLFISFEFLFYFLAPVIALSYCFACLDERLSIWFIVAASLFFYSHWYLPHLSLLSGSIFLNFWLANKIKTVEVKLRRPTLILAVMFNLSLLFWFKYAVFFTQNFNALFVANTTLQLWLRDLVLPLGISFFTFQQISFLIDLYKGQIKLPKFSKYVFFVSFFPNLLLAPSFGGKISKIK